MAIIWLLFFLILGMNHAVSHSIDTAEPFLNTAYGYRNKLPVPPKPFLLILQGTLNTEAGISTGEIKVKRDFEDTLSQRLHLPGNQHQPYLLRYPALDGQATYWPDSFKIAFIAHSFP